MNPPPREAELLILQLKTKHGEHCEVATGGSLIPSQEIYSGSGSLKKPIQNYAVDAVKRLRCITGTTCPCVAGVVESQNDTLVQTFWYFSTDIFTHLVQCFKVFNNLTIAVKSDILYPKMQCFTALPRSYSETSVSAVA